MLPHSWCLLLLPVARTVEYVDMPQERMLCFIVREFGTADMVPKAALLQFLHQEYEVRCHSRLSPAFPDSEWVA